MASKAPKATEWVVITGAPSSGKTSVIDVLARRGFSTVKEAARDFINHCLDHGKTLEQVRDDVVGMQDHILELGMKWDEGLDPAQMIFLDRGLPDSISYLRAAGLDTAKAETASRLYHYKAVFIFDRLPVVADGIRTEDEKVAATLDRLLEEDYTKLGYKPVRVPVLPVEARADFILQSLGISRVY